MGGLGSGSKPDDFGNDNHRGGRQKKNAIAVQGTGEPHQLDMLPDVKDAWDRLNEVVAGVAFSQDSEVLWIAASNLALLHQMFPGVRAAPEGEMLRDWLAVCRFIMPVLGKFGMTPRDRQMLLVPRKEEEAKDPFEALSEEL